MGTHIHQSVLAETDRMLRGITFPACVRLKDVPALGFHGCFLGRDQGCYLTFKIARQELFGVVNRLGMGNRDIARSLLH